MTPAAFKINLFQTAHCALRCAFSLDWIHTKEDFSQTVLSPMLLLLLLVSHRLAFCPGPAESAGCTLCQLWFQSLTPCPCSLPQELLTQMDFSFVDVLGSMFCFCLPRQRPLISISFHRYSSLRVSLCVPGHTKPSVSSSLLSPLRIMHFTFSEVCMWKVHIMSQRILTVASTVSCLVFLQ